MSEPSVSYRIKHDFPSRGYDGRTFWVHPRVGVIPPTELGANATAVLTMQKALLNGIDVFEALHSMTSSDLGQTWTSPQEQENFRRTDVRIGTPLPELEPLQILVCDFWPGWHSASEKLLGTGMTTHYTKNNISLGYVGPTRHDTAYAVYDATEQRWNDWQILEMPDQDKFKRGGAGCTQRLDLPDGDVLLPIYYESDTPGVFIVTVVRCSFDGKILGYLEHGTELSVHEGDGLCEPSLTQFDGRFYLTLRNSLCGYVALSDDGLNFDAPRVWRFDDGEELGNFNTQQHWVAHSGGLFLAYTRRGLNNNHVWCNRAPIVMAQVDPETLRVIRKTERVIVPERGARYGNFGVTHVSESETWVTESEWLQNGHHYSRNALEKLGWLQPGEDFKPGDDCRLDWSKECEQFGSDNTVWVARLLWDQPNRQFGIS